MLILAVAALAVSLAVPIVAGARVVPQKSIGKVRIGNSEANLDAKLPDPVQLIRTTGIVSGAPINLWVYSGLKIEFEGGNRVTAVRTTRRFERTARGAGVGTPKKLLRKLHPKIRCGKGKSTICQLGRPNRIGAKATTFELERGRVVSIAVHRVL